MLFPARPRSKSAPIASSPSGVASTATSPITFTRTAGRGIPDADQAMPHIIPHRIGLCRIPARVFIRSPLLILPLPGLIISKITTAIILYSGTQPIIINGAILEFPYIFCTKAIPSKAALLRYDACINSPLISFFFRNMDAAAAMRILAVVAMKQKPMNFPSQTLKKSAPERSLHRTAGKEMLNTKWFILSAKSRFRIPVILNAIPSSTRQNIGTVAFSANIRCSILLYLIYGIHLCSIPPHNSGYNSGSLMFNPPWDSIHFLSHGLPIMYIRHRDTCSGKTFQ